MLPYSVFRAIWKKRTLPFRQSSPVWIHHSMMVYAYLLCHASFQFRPIPVHNAGLTSCRPSPYTAMVYIRTNLRLTEWHRPDWVLYLTWSQASWCLHGLRNGSFMPEKVTSLNGLKVTSEDWLPCVFPLIFSSTLTFRNVVTVLIIIKANKNS